MMINLIKFFLLATIFAPAAWARSPVVFIHGIKGAELRGPDGELFWLSTPQALGLSNADIALQTRFEPNGEQPRGPLKATAVMAQIDLIPHLVSVDVYGPFLEMGRDSGRTFLPFFYDWRRDNEETLLVYERFVEDAAKKSDTGKVSVISHSMGGLLTLALLNKRPELFESAVFAGVPFKGGIGFLADLHVGADTGLNGKIAGPEVLATFPSVFSLFPLENQALLDVNRNPVPFDFFRAEDWKRLKLGPYAEGRTPPPGYDAFLAGALAREKAFRERLVVKPGVVYPPVLIINSKAHPTLHKVVLGGRMAMAGVDFEAAPKEDGDGRVAFTTSLPPEGLKYEMFTTDEDHSGLLNDPKAAAAALAFPAKPN
jgi:pimeloyl-ACP methyl ester carboxylesterase